MGGIMEARELMSGNIVLLGGDEHIVTVNSIEYYNTFKPILLTEEWLLKFGFRYQSNSNVLFVDFKGVRHYIQLLSDETYSYYIFKPLNQYPLKNVHSLQNLYFALTGEQLIIG
jgi:hypothetical protein